MEPYKFRIADQLLQYRLEEVGAVLVEGTKWCGKTTTCEQAAKSVLYLADPEMKAQYIDLANTQVKALLTGDTPHLIDEWQLAPQLWDAIRFEVDHRRSEGQFILTGSSVPPSTDKISHTGTGRFAWLKMRPMSLYESGDSTGEVSLEQLFDNANIEGRNTLNLEKMAYLVCRGGWPASLGKSERVALRTPYNYYDAVVQSDISRVDNVERNPLWADTLMRSYARLQGSQASSKVILDDMLASVSQETLSTQTVENYLTALRKMFVVEDLPAWCPNLRSKTAIRTSPTRYFVDPAIAVAALRVSPKDLMADLRTFGFLFETLCIRDLRVYAEAIDGQVFHYRDKTELECDAVIHLRNGKYGLVEIKLGGDEAIAAAVKTLNSLENKINTDQMMKPAFKAVLTAVGQFAYRRSDGIYIIPVACLKVL